MPFGQHQGTELWNNQIPETKILRLPALRRMRGLAYMASRDKVDVDAFHKGIQYALERLGKSKFGFESTTVSNFKSKSHEGSRNELVDYSRAPCLGADQKARGLWERDCCHAKRHFLSLKLNFTSLYFVGTACDNLEQKTSVCRQLLFLRRMCRLKLQQKPID